MNSRLILLASAMAATLLGCHAPSRGTNASTSPPPWGVQASASPQKVQMTADDQEEKGCTERAELRKQRTMARLRGEGVPVIDWLPCIEDEDEAHIRRQSEVVDRAIALMGVAGKGERAPEALLERFAREFELPSKLSPNEKEFWEAPAPSPQECSTFTWRYEALAVLLWSLSYLPNLERPTEQVDAAKLGEIILRRGAATFSAEAKLRPAAELLDFADLMYRYHWAVRDAQVHQRPPPAGLSSDIVMEWDWAVRWLVGSLDQDWDDISLDT